MEKGEKEKEGRFLSLGGGMGLFLLILPHRSLSPMEFRAGTEGGRGEFCLLISSAYFLIHLLTTCPVVTLPTMNWALL